MKQHADEAKRQMNERMIVSRPGFDQADGRLSVLGQTIGEDATRRTRADDDVVE